MAYPKALTDEEAARAVAAYQAGATLLALADRYGCSVHPIRNALEAAGVPYRRKGAKRTVEGLEPRIAREYQEGATIRELGEVYEINTRTVTRILDEEGVARRPTGRRSAR